MIRGVSMYRIRVRVARITLRGPVAGPVDRGPGRLPWAGWHRVRPADRGGQAVVLLEEAWKRPGRELEAAPRRSRRSPGGPPGKSPENRCDIRRGRVLRMCRRGPGCGPEHPKTGPPVGRTGLGSYV